MREEDMMTLQEKADLELLSLSNEKYKFVLEYGPLLPPLQAAFERGIDKEWFTFVDLCPAAAMPATALLPLAGQRSMRVFRLTQAGVDRLNVLKFLKEGERHAK